MLNDGLFRVSVMSQRKPRFSCQIFTWTGNFGLHLDMTSQYTYSIIGLFRIAVGPDEQFGLDRVRINTEGFMFRLRLKGDAY